MSGTEDRAESTISCHACAYARPVRAPFEDWIWCDHPQDGLLLNLSRDADCRRPNGGKLRRATAEANPEGGDSDGKAEAAG